MGPRRLPRAPVMAAAVTVALVVGAALAGCSTAGGSTDGGASPAAAVAGLFDQDATTSTTAPAVAVTPLTPSPAPPPAPCAGNRRAQYIHVSITDQHAWLCAGNHLAYDTAVTTGMSGADTHTPTGTYQIQGRNTDTTLLPSTGEAYPVKYWIPFDAPLFGFHDSSWQHFPYGSSRYRTEGSHGCIHMPLRAMKFLYDWVRIGATVRITA